MPAADVDFCMYCKDDIHYAGQMLNFVVVGHLRCEGAATAIQQVKETSVRRLASEAGASILAFSLAGVAAAASTFKIADLDMHMDTTYHNVETRKWFRSRLCFFGSRQHAFADALSHLKGRCSSRA